MSFLLFQFKLIILLALLIGVLYSIHILVKDYQAITAAGRFLRFLSKRDLHSNNNLKPHVRWRLILQHDPLQCARYLFCDIGARPLDTELRKGFTLMLSLPPREEDASAHAVFKAAYNIGKQSRLDSCKTEFFMCPFDVSLLFQLVQYLLRSH